jgi:hypothetical protein
VPGGIVAAHSRRPDIVGRGVRDHQRCGLVAIMLLRSAAPSAMDRASSRCRPPPQWLIRACLWANLWMTCAYVPRICAQRGDNAVGFREAEPLARPLPGQRPSTPCAQGEKEMCPQRSLHQCIR